MIALPAKSLALEDVDGDGRIVVLCFGDSITKGTLLGAYPAKLRELLAGRASVIGEGVYGERTAEGRERLRGLLERERPDYVILLEGINDGCNVPAERVVQNLRAMADEARRRGAVPLIGTVFVSPALRGGLLRRCAERINAGIRTLPVDVVEFASVMEGHWDEWTPDGLHPNNRGCDALAEAAARALEASRAERRVGLEAHTKSRSAPPCSAQILFKAHAQPRSPSARCLSPPLQPGPGR